MLEPINPLIPVIKILSIYSQSSVIILFSSNPFDNKKFLNDFIINGGPEIKYVAELPLSLKKFSILRASLKTIYLKIEKR